MVSNLNQLEINVNLCALQAGFINQELHYIIAKDEQDFRFVSWDEEPHSPDENKYYCFLLQQALLIPAGNISLKESYILREKPFYPIVANVEDFARIIKSMGKGDSKKCIRRFFDKEIDELVNSLRAQFDEVEKHLIQSDEARHLVLVIDDAEVSVSENMVYFRQRAPFALEHYEHVKEEG